mgnify:CR=1 FL=1
MCIRDRLHTDWLTVDSNLKKLDCTVCIEFSVFEHNVHQLPLVKNICKERSLELKIKEGVSLHPDGFSPVVNENKEWLSGWVEKVIDFEHSHQKFEWNCGNNVWHIETVAKSHLREIMKWTKEYFRTKLEINQPIKWLRIKDRNIYRRSEKYKREFHLHA